MPDVLIDPGRYQLRRSFKGIEIFFVPFHSGFANPMDKDHSNDDQVKGNDKKDPGKYLMHAERISKPGFIAENK
jgi:hypothetical protein